MKSFEQIAEAIYEAFAKALSDNPNDSRNPLPPAWHELPSAIQAGWIAAARAAHKEITEVH